MNEKDAGRVGFILSLAAVIAASGFAIACIGFAAAKLA